MHGFGQGWNIAQNLRQRIMYPTKMSWLFHHRTATTKPKLPNAGPLALRKRDTFSFIYKTSVSFLKSKKILKPWYSSPVKRDSRFPCIMVWKKCAYFEMVVGPIFFVHPSKIQSYVEESRPHSSLLLQQGITYKLPNSYKVEIPRRQDVHSLISRVAWSAESVIIKRGQSPGCADRGQRTESSEEGVLQPFLFCNMHT